MPPEGQFALWASHLAHLRLSAALTPGPRQVRTARFGRGIAYPDRAEHSRALRDLAVHMRDQHRRRAPVLSVSPELILLVSTNRVVDPEDFRRAGIEVLEQRGEESLVAFASDPELAAFLERNEAYAEGPRAGLTPMGNPRSAQYEAFFDAIVDARSLTPEDVLSPRVVAKMSEPLTEGARIRLDIECWCSEDSAEAKRRQDDVQIAIAAADGRVLASDLNIRAGLSAFYVELPLARVSELATVDRIRWIDVLPQPLLTHPQVTRALPDDLPVISSPDPKGPILAIIDSGVRSAHPLLAPAIAGVEYVGAGIPDGGDESGHGTFVASLALYGSLEPLIAENAPARAAGRLLSVRVLDANNDFPDDGQRWETTLLTAMGMAVEGGARVINLSLGDDRRPYSPPRPSPVAAMVDEFARAHDVVVVVSTGNLSFKEISDEGLRDRSYVEELLGSESDFGLLDPAPAALALTVGSLCPDEHQGVSRPTMQTSLSVVGHPEWPSPFTRRGPGVMSMIKPELAAPGGTVVFDAVLGRVSESDMTRAVVGAGGQRPDTLLEASVGTSFAAPLVSHAALRVLGRYPALSANAVRALVLSSATEIEPLLTSDRPSDATQQARRLTGYGRVQAERAEFSTDHRAVLVAEHSIAVDDVHLYEVPLPGTFFASGGTTSVSIALTYDPPVRGTRLDYLASRMSFRAYFGAGLDRVKAAYVALAGDAETDDDETPPALERSEIKLQPASSQRSLGANQLGRFERKIAWDREKAGTLIVVVRNVNRWDTPGAQQAYALSVVLEADDNREPLYADLSAQLEALAEIEVEAEAEAEV